MFHRKIEARDIIALFCFLYLWSRSRCDCSRTMRVSLFEQRLVFSFLLMPLKLVTLRQKCFLKGVLGGHRLDLSLVEARYW